MGENHIRLNSLVTFACVKVQYQEIVSENSNYWWLVLMAQRNRPLAMVDTQQFRKSPVRLISLYQSIDYLFTYSIYSIERQHERTTTHPHWFQCYKKKSTFILHKDLMRIHRIGFENSY